MPCIYQIFCKENGKSYIGQSRFDSPIPRYTRHWNDAPRCKNKTPLVRAMLKYGKDSFELRCLCICSKDALDNLEQYYAEIYESYVWDFPGGYNAVPCGKGRAPDFHHKEEHKKKMSELMTGRKISNSQKEKQSKIMKGRILKEAHRDSIAEFQRKRFNDEIFPTRLNEWIVQYNKKGKSPDSNSEDVDEKRAGQWRQDMISKRYAPSKKTGRPLTDEQIKVLDETTGWTWKKPDEFLEQFENFKTQYQLFNGILSRKKDKDHWDRYRASLWVNAMRVKKRNNHPYLTPERIKMLDECEIWSWTAKR